MHRKIIYVEPQVAELEEAARAAEHDGPPVELDVEVEDPLSSSGEARI